MSSPVLVVLAHPDLSTSRVNKALAEAASAIKGVTVHNLYGAYPDLFVDGSAERKRIDEAGVLVLQHPIYWYAAPGLLKEWLDRTFISGWAYGPNGTALKGKKLLSSITTGSDADAYAADGAHGNPIDDYLKPYRQTAGFCGMKWQQPLIFHHARGAEQPELDTHVKTFTTRLQKLARQG